MGLNYGRPDKINKTQQMQRNRMWVDSTTKRLLRFYSDPERKQRRELPKCSYCYYYYGGLAGQAFCNSLCAECGKEMTFSTTDYDYCCPDCAKKLGICKHCGATLD